MLAFMLLIVGVVGRAGDKLGATTDPPERMATPHEVAEFLGVPVKTLHWWHHTGKGPTPRKIGKHLRWFWPDVIAWAQQQAEEGRVR